MDNFLSDFDCFIKRNNYSETGFLRKIGVYPWFVARVRGGNDFRIKTLKRVLDAMKQYEQKK